MVNLNAVCHFLQSFHDISDIACQSIVRAKPFLRSAAWLLNPILPFSVEEEEFSAYEKAALEAKCNLQVGGKNFALRLVNNEM